MFNDQIDKIYARLIARGTKRKSLSILAADGICRLPRRAAPRRARARWGNFARATLAFANERQLKSNARPVIRENVLRSRRAMLSATWREIAILRGADYDCATSTHHVPRYVRTYVPLIV